MSLADQKAQFIQQYGDPCKIMRPTGNLSTTGRILAVKRKTDLFSLNFLREGTFIPSSQVQRADLIQNEATGEQFLVVSYQSKTLGGSITTINTELYMVNYAAVSILRQQKNVDENLNVVAGSQSWNQISALPANVAHVSAFDQYKAGLLLPNTVMHVVMQTQVSVQLQDRLLIDGNPYAVHDVNLSQIMGLQVLQLKVDERK